MPIAEIINYISVPELNIENDNDLEKTVMNNENNKGEFIDRIFSDEQKVLKSTVKEILNDIDLRKNIKKDLQLRIDCDIGNCKIKIDLQNKPYLLDRDTSLNAQLESKVIDLEQEKRKEDVECWRDIMFLKKYLMSALQDYWLSFRRTQLLQDNVFE